MVLVVGLQRARVRIERDHGAGVEVVAGVEVARPRPRVADAPEREVELRVVRALDPDRPAAVLPVVALPGVRAGLARRRDRVGSPEGVAGPRVEGLDEAPDGQLAAGRPHHDLAPDDQRGQRAVVPLVIVLDDLVPHDSARLGVEGDQVGIDRGEIDLVLVEPHAPVRRMELQEVVGQVLLVVPEDVAVLRVQREDLVLRRRDEHDAVVDHRRRLVTLGDAGAQRPDRRQLPRVLRSDLVEGAVSPAGVIASVHEPVLGLGVQEPRVGHGAVVMDLRRRHGRRQPEHPHQ